MKNKLVFLSLLSLLITFGAMAQTKVTMPWAAAPAENGSFTVPINVTNLNAGAISLTITYNTNAMSFTSVSSGAPVTFAVNNNASTGTLKLGWYSTTALNITSGNLIYLNFKYKTGAGSYAFSTATPGDCEIASPTGEIYSNISYEGGSLLLPPVATNATNVTSGNFTANWQSVNGAVNYYFDVSTNSNFDPYLEGYKWKYVNGLFYSVSNLNPGNTYYYRVRAYRNGVQSRNSNIITVKTLTPPPVLSLPVNGTTLVPTSTTLSWNAVSGADTYTLQISTSSSFSTLFLNDITSGTSTPVSGLANGTTYYWRVIAKTSSQTPITDWSSVWSFTTILAGPVLSSPVNGTTLVPTSTTFSWGAVSGADTYTLQISTSSSFSTLFLNDITSGTSMPVSGLANGTTYYWRVIAKTSSQTPITDWSSVWSFTTVAVSGISAPVATAATYINSVSFRANWVAVTGATKYYLDVSTSSNFNSCVSGYQDKDVGNVVVSSVSGLNANTTYYYRVRAYNGSTSPNSNTITLTTAPPIPTATAATSITSTSFYASWGAVTGATLYYFDVSTVSDFSSYVSGYQWKSVTATICSVTGLSPGTTYYYRVRSYGNGAQSSSSNTIAVTTIAPPVLYSPANGATGIPTSTTFSWGAVSGAQTYTVQISTNSSFSTGIFLNSITSGTSMSVSGLAMGTTYYWRVIATTSSQTPITDWSSVWSFTTAINTYTLTVNCGYGGSVSGSGTVTQGVPRTITATAITGYYFVNWSVTSGNATIANANSATTTVIVNSNATITANFSTISYTISGSIIYSSYPAVGVTMNGLPGSPTTDYNGYYSATVPYGWSGTVTPTKAGYTFSPASQTYINVSSNQVTNYTGTPITYTISGRISYYSSPVVGVTMNGLPGNPTTDNGGYYSATVPNGWSGTVTPQVTYFQFTPASTTYSNVTSNITTNYTGRLGKRGGNQIAGLPFEFALKQNAPNPFNPSTNIYYQLPDLNTRFAVSLKVYDILGKEVATLVDGMKETGYYMVTFNAAHLPSGIYFARIIALPENGDKPFNNIVKMLLMK